MAQKPRSQPKQDDPKQSKVFIAKAREIGSANDGAAADELLGHLAKLPPQPKQQKRK